MKINRTPEFKRNYKRLKRKHYDMSRLKRVIGLLAVDHKTKKQVEKLRKRHKDHGLNGKYKGLRALHVDRQYDDNWVLVYEIHHGELDLHILNLIRTGNHDQSYR